MKKAAALLLTIIALGSALAAQQQGAEALVEEAAAYLAAFFQGKGDVCVAIVALDDRAGLGDSGLQKLYQMLAARLEANPAIRFADLLVAVADGRADFNLDRARELDFLVELRLLRGLDKVGLGLAVFSRLQDRVVALKYLERAIPAGERDLLRTRSFAFAAMGFAKLLEFEARAGLLDIRSLAAADGAMQYYFYYPDEIVIYQAREAGLEKRFQFKLKWGRPYFPTRHPEGRLLLFRSGSDLVLTAGGNFSPYSQVLTFRDNAWQEAGRVDFVPFRFVSLNHTPYLVGARWEEGRNFLKERIFFQPYDPAAAAGAGLMQKQVCAAMALDIAAADGQLQAVHAIDRDYSYRMYGADLVERTPLPGKKGGSLAALGGQWLALSDFSRSADRLFFCDIRDGGLRPVYETAVAGEVRFLADGTWHDAPGFWAGVEQDDGDGSRLLVQFWGKAHE
jgi:hypothetical protein